MSQPWENDPIVSAPQPQQFPGILQGGPKVPEPKDPYDVTQDKQETISDLRQEFRKLKTIESYDVALAAFNSSLTTADNPQGDQSLITSYAKMLDPTSAVREGEFDTTSKTENYINQVKARLAKEFGFEDGGMLTPEGRTFIRQEMLNLVEQRFQPPYERDREDYTKIAETYGYDPAMIVISNPMDRYAERIEAFRNPAPEPSSVGAEWTAEQSREHYGGQAYFNDDGTPLGPDGGFAYDAEGQEIGLIGRSTDESPNQTVIDEADRLDKLQGKRGGIDLVKQGVTFGLLDQSSGVGTAIGGLLRGDTNIGANYRLGRDAENLRLDRARESIGGVASTGLEVAGGMLTPMAAIKGANSVFQAGKTGAIAGGVGGYGYGEGLEGSTVNALAGATLGAGIGAAGQKAGNALATHLSGKAANKPNANTLANAGGAEGVTVNRAMVEPKYANRVTGVDASQSGGPQLQRGMREVEGQIEARAAKLGGEGEKLNQFEGGNTVREAGERFIDKTGASAAAKYTRAERMAGDTKIPPKATNQALDDLIGELSEASNMNSAEIKFLNGLRDDFSSDLSVAGMRGVRTKLNAAIRNNSLTLDPSSSRLLALKKAISDDISSGLTNAGKGKAAKAFSNADKSYAARQQYIDDTLKGLLGTKKTPTTPERAWQRFEAMAREGGQGNSTSLRKFYSTLNADEKADVATTFAEQLGKNNAGEFSVSHFLSQTEKMSDGAIRTVFGKEGAQSIKNLRLLGQQVKRVTGAMNSRKSTTAVGRSYRDWLWDATIGAGGGATLGGAVGGTLTGGIGAVAGMGAVAGGKSVANRLSARSLLSPKISQWLSKAPATQTPKAIDAHFSKLGQIAKAEPALAGEIEILQRNILSAANDNASRMSAVAEDVEDQIPNQ